VNALDKYLIFGLPKVHGWLDLYSTEFIALLSKIQQDAGYSGSIGEAGVHHGKLFILLLLTSGGHDKAFAIDVFEQQHLNVDQSGHGDKAVLLRNIARWAPVSPPVTLIERSSLDVRPEDILAIGGEARIISIDGGHTEECVLNDLHLSEGALSAEGIVIVDDCFNESWPDVVTGVARYLLDSGARLRPFAISPNKLYLTWPAAKELYRARLGSLRQYKPDKRSRMFSEDIEIYGVSHADGTVARAKDLIKQSTLGPYLMAAKARLSHRYPALAAINR
jgi:hypothetical protein